MDWIKHLIAISALGISQSVSAQSWLCIADKATGFSYKAYSKSWDQADFKTEKSRYVIKSAKSDRNAWEVYEFGATNAVFPNAWCEKDFTDTGFLHCDGLLTEFKFNKNNGRFLHTYQGQYLAYNPRSALKQFQTDGGDTPFIEIGTCSEI